MRTPGTEAATSLRLATWNILHGIVLPAAAVDATAVARAIAALDVDVAALQEVDRCQPRSGEVDQSAAIAEQLGWQHAFGASLVGNPDTAWELPGDHDPSGPAYGVAIVSRHPLSEVEVTRLPGAGSGSRTKAAALGRPGYDREPRVALSATVRVGPARLQLTVAHLSYLPWRGLRQASFAARAAAARTGPAVLTGDLNLPAWLVRPLAGLPPHRWAWAGGGRTYPSWQPRMQLDHLLVRGGAVVTAVEVGAASTSDHLPLIATLALPPA